ncbi:hypothetical protein L6452_01138 [Arctium lappa]|uniref:Uncharacterized protein n=1 Tax=Arctium lappa TaxID=4217 RepID=A0ACB9FFA8_ARCLA|nr:hypothetical protein L6452_01138 [Arctium lappa]
MFCAMAIEVVATIEMNVAGSDIVEGLLLHWFILKWQQCLLWPNTAAGSASSVMIARGALWNASIFHLEGIPVEDVVKREYVRKLYDMNRQEEDETVTQIRSEIEAKRAAHKIFLNVARAGSKYVLYFIYLNDLMRFLREDQTVKTMALLVGTPGDEKVSKGALKTWVVHAFRERKALALTLNDTKTAVNKLHQMVNVTEIVLHNLKGECWTVNSISTLKDQTLHTFGGGWMAFVRDNGIQMGDICIFELVGICEMRVHVPSVGKNAALDYQIGHGPSNE